jgi:hypothetical protein
LEELLTLLSERFGIEPDKLQDILQTAIGWLKDHPQQLASLLGNVQGIEGLDDLGDVGNLVGKLFNR